MERLDIVRQLVSDCDIKVTDMVGNVAAELEARGAGIQPLDTKALTERLAAVAGNELATEVDEHITAIANLYGDAGFLVGYYTRANPEWLIFDDDTD